MWPAILFAPTLVGTVDGMTVEWMPELGWRFGYPFAVFLMGLVSLTIFRRRAWL